MMRSMYSGVSGLKTHQIKMDVIGNNISNVNTVAYKSNSITFSELMYQTTQKASGANEKTGGTNARQIGLGVRSGAINTAISSQGATQTTGNPFDVCITGKSFFIVSDGNTNYFTRAGAFNVDAVGNLVMASNGYKVMGWGLETRTDADGNVLPVEGSLKTDEITSPKLMSPENMTYKPEATTLGLVTGIIDRNDPDIAKEAGRGINFAIYDSGGNAYTAKFSVHKTAEVGKFYVQLDDVVDVNGLSVKDIYNVEKLSDIVTINDSSQKFAATVNNSFKMLDTVKLEGTNFQKRSDSSNIRSLGDFGSQNSEGNYELTIPLSDENATALKNIYGSDLDTDTISEGYITAEGMLYVTAKEGLGVNLSYNISDGSFSSIGGSPKITLNFEKAVTDADGKTHDLSNFSSSEIDWSTTNMYNNSGTSTLAARAGDSDGLGSGRKQGKMTGITIQNDGKIYSSYDNGMTRLLGQIAVAEFTNPEGLEKAGDNLYTSSLNSGDFDGKGVDITGSGGYMSTGVLEMSNVDLSAEFTEMITTQRGFQANSRIITVSDTMLEELVNLKR